MKLTTFQEKIWKYYRENKRDFPWRKRPYDPYAIMVSEIMLQQTQTDRVVPKYEAWLKAFPTPKALADAPLQKVLSLWQGLGYNRRALALKRAAEIITNDYNGKFPREYEKILALPGVGPYTAGAIMAFAFNKPFPIIETNIRTVFIHHFFSIKAAQSEVSRFVGLRPSRVTPLPATTQISSQGGRMAQAAATRDSHNARRSVLPRTALIHDRDLSPFIEKTLDLKNPREWYYALMDYGVMIKKTVGNANTKSRHYTKQSPFKGSNRELRSAILKQITAKPQTEAMIIQTVGSDPLKIKMNLEALTKEGFITLRRGRYVIV